MPTFDESADILAIDALGVRLAFRRDGDRWTHAIEIVEGGASRELARAVEGGDDPGRVPSPAFQELQFQREGDGAEVIQALLVGRSGPHYASAVFTVRETAGEVRIEVEVADRCREPIASLASTYVVGLSTDLLGDASPSRVSWDLRPGVLAIEAADPSRLDLREAGRRAALVQASARIEPGRASHCWSYAWIIPGASPADPGP